MGKQEGDNGGVASARGEVEGGATFPLFGLINAGATLEQEGSNMHVPAVARPHQGRDDALVVDLEEEGEREGGRGSWRKEERKKIRFLGPSKSASPSSCTFRYILLASS